jgi:fumarate reductase flavoprotein subunit
MSVRAAAGVEFPIAVPVVVIGAGACGLTAALAARDASADVLVLERDASPSGSTALSSGLIPAAGTKVQAALGIDDTAALFAADIQAKAHGENDPAFVAAIASASGPTIDWLIERHRLELTLVEGFLYPGHSRMRMHAPPSRSGADLVAGLLAAARAAGADIVSGAQATALYAEPGGRVAGVELRRPNGAVERIGCGTLVLACSGFGGDPALVRRHIPEMGTAYFHGHAGNRGDALRWGEALGAATRHLGAYQGHGSVATPHNILVTWALMMEGGIQVNALGRRFSNEHAGYSEQAMCVLAQPGGVAWDIYDERLHRLGLGFDDYREADKAGAVRRADTLAALAAACGLPHAALAGELAGIARLAAGVGEDRFGRDFRGKPALAPPYYAVKVTGALFHTQGGLAVDADARVLRPDGTPLANLFAGGGAACGVSGSGRDGYLSGNGLLAAVVLGAKAGSAAARLVGAARRAG